MFDGAAPNLAGTLMTFGEERRLWVMAGARGLSLLTAPSLEIRVNTSRRSVFSFIQGANVKNLWRVCGVSCNRALAQLSSC